MSQKLDNISAVSRFFSSKTREPSNEETAPSLVKDEHDILVPSEKKVKEQDPIKRTKRAKTGRKSSPLLGPKSSRVAAVHFRVSAETRKKWKLKATKYGLSMEELVVLAIENYKGENASDFVTDESSDLSEE